jgi:hypothetical protein
MLLRFRTACLTAVLLATTIAAARVVSYAPYSDRTAFVGVQHRLNRHFVVVEGPAPSGYSGPILSPLPYYNGYPYGQVVVYDSTGAEEPRVVLPADGSLAGFSMLAVRENAQHVPTILVETNSTLGGLNPQQQWLMMLSKDGGNTWTHVLAPNFVIPQLGSNTPDLGGAFARGRYSPVRIGTDDYPFIVGCPTGVFAIGTDGVARVLAPSNQSAPLLGTDLTGSQLLVRTEQTKISVVDLSGHISAPITVDGGGVYEGWITSDGSVYLEELFGSVRSLKLWRGGVLTDVAGATSGSTDPMAFFAVPTFDYNGAWMIQRGNGNPTTLLLHTVSGGVQQQWQDITGPEVEALIPGASGKTVLIQVHRTRPQADQRLFKDPALAVWTVGDPAPSAYDELYLNEQVSKGFVHVDVDRIAAGEPFVFDSGPQPANGGGGGGVIISPFPGGGGDVTQEWGVVRASLKQHLVLPGIGRIEGAYGSFWQSDVVIYNPSAARQNVVVRWVPTGSGPVIDQPQQKTLTLEPMEIRVIADALKTLFGFDSGNGAFFLDPDFGINATSRTYTRGGAGSYGYGTNAIDIFSATRPRFPVTFSGAFAGENFRTNLVLTDVSGRGTVASTLATGANGAMGANDLTIAAAPNGQQQLNSIGLMLGLLPGDTGALRVQPARGEAIASVYTIDNRTNDPTYFPPDLPAQELRTIPLIGHVDGANNSKFRSDLYVFNPSAQPRTVTLSVKAIDQPETPTTLTLTLLPNEARVIRDVLFNAFGKTGLARLRYQSQSDTASVRVTSRTYTIDANGGTYGFLMPPLNNFQIAGAGDTLEILGAIGDKNFRTNLGLVELTAFPNNTNVVVKVDIIDNAGRQIDSFSVNVPVAGGVQLPDLFHARNLGDGPPAALIRISPVSGMIGAWATIIDNGTNDPTYLGAQLGAK